MVRRRRNTDRAKAMEKKRQQNYRASKLKSGEFTRKGTEQIYRKGPQGGKSFPHGILTSEDNYGGYHLELQSCSPECKENEICRCNYLGRCKCEALYHSPE